MVELVGRLPFVGAAEHDSNNADKLLGCISYVPGSRNAQISGAAACEKRPYYRVGAVSLASSFPLGLAEARKISDHGVQSTMSTAGALPPSSRWPTPEEMQAAAKQPHMRGWKAAAIMRAADVSESLQQILKPVVTRLTDLWEALKQWLIQHWLTGVLGLLVLILLIILMAFAALLREVRCMAWLLMQWDYPLLGVLGRHISGERGARQYYRAMARLFTWRGMPRA